MVSSVMSKERVKSLKKLAALMNTRHQIPVPMSEPLLRCMDHVLTSEEIEYLIEMGTDPYTYEQASSRSSLSEEQFDIFFEALIRKGYVWPYDRHNGGESFQLPGFLMGAFEVFLADGQETSEKQEFARRIDSLLLWFRKLNKFPSRQLFNAKVRKSKSQQSILVPGRAPTGDGKRSTIEVGKAIDVEPAKVYPAKTIEALIEKHGDGQSIAVVHCFCRQYRKMLDSACRFEHPPQSCIAVGSLAKFAVQHGVGRHLSKLEAIELVRELQSNGAIHQVFHKDEDINNPEMAICNCCWDCCGVLSSYNRGIIPLKLHAYYKASLPDESACNGCATCADYCPVRAISIVDDLCRIDSEKCIGCGQCELQCSQEAILMVANERTVFLPMLKKSEARIQS